ncbi:hypothetical protein C8R46DRAFT_1325448 [Mycena filopes]|nr:hypothetical protein C8R46DRAFT_1325448 [Mycena filopes]
MSDMKLSQADATYTSSTPTAGTSSMAGKPDPSYNTVLDHQQPFTQIHSNLFLVNQGYRPAYGPMKGDTTIMEDLARQIAILAARQHIPLSVVPAQYLRSQLDFHDPLHYQLRGIHPEIYRGMEDTAVIIVASNLNFATPEWSCLLDNLVKMSSESASSPTLNIHLIQLDGGPAAFRPFFSGAGVFKIDGDGVLVTPDAPVGTGSSIAVGDNAATLGPEIQWGSKAKKALQKLELSPPGCDSSDIDSAQYFLASGHLVMPEPMPWDTGAGAIFCSHQDVVSPAPRVFDTQLRRHGVTPEHLAQMGSQEARQSAALGPLKDYNQREYLDLPPEMKKWSWGNVEVHQKFVERKAKIGALQLRYGPPRPIPIPCGTTLIAENSVEKWLSTRSSALEILPPLTAQLPPTQDPVACSETAEDLHQFAEKRVHIRDWAIIKLSPSTTARPPHPFRPAPKDFWTHPQVGSVRWANDTSARAETLGVGRPHAWLVERDGNGDGMRVARSPVGFPQEIRGAAPRDGDSGTAVTTITSFPEAGVLCGALPVGAILGGLATRDAAHVPFAYLTDLSDVAERILTVLGLDPEADAEEIQWAVAQRSMFDVGEHER